MSDDIIERTESVRSVKARQVIWVDWMREATEGLTDDDMVQTVSRWTPFATYLLGIRVTPI